MRAALTGAHRRPRPWLEVVLLVVCVLTAGGLAAYLFLWALLWQALG
jgi:hypothetical protein